jgi:predicted GNAT family N-acyltransferase
MKWRDYQLEDKEACLEIFHSNVPAYFAPKELSDVTRLLDGMFCPYLVIEDNDGRIIASGGIWADQADQSATLCWVMVARQWHGKGLGRFLVLKLLNLLRRFPFVTLVKLDTSQHTSAFYEKFGFEKCGFTDNYYAEGLHRFDMEMPWNEAKLTEVSANLAALTMMDRSEGSIDE